MSHYSGKLILIAIFDILIGVGVFGGVVVPNILAGIEAKDSFTKDEYAKPAYTYAFVSLCSVLTGILILFSVSMKTETCLLAPTKSMETLIGYCFLIFAILLFVGDHDNIWPLVPYGILQTVFLMIFCQYRDEKLQIIQRDTVEENLPAPQLPTEDNIYV